MLKTRIKAWGKGLDFDPEEQIAMLLEEQFGPGRFVIDDARAESGSLILTIRSGSWTETKEFALLELLLRHPGQVIDRSSITAHVWDNNHDPFANVLEVLVRRLRSKIDDGFEPKLIHTIRGAGYRIGPAT